MKRILFLCVLLIATTILTSCGGVNVTINFDTDGGTEIESINTDGASSISIPNNPEKEGFVFDGWYWDEGTFLRPFTANSLLDEPISGDLTVYAKWLPESLLTTNFEVIFDTQGGSAVDTQTVVFRDTIIEPDEPTRLGYLFAGWYTDRNYNEEWNFVTGKVENDMTLYAKWNVISEDYHIVHFVSNFDVDVPSQQVLKGSALTAPNISREGYTLEGWYTSLNNGITLDEKWSFTSNVVNSNFTLYAKWTINQYTISFESNGGSLVNSITRDYGTSINQPQNPFKSGYMFGGWYTDQSLETPFDFDTMPAANMTLYAEWLRTLNFETNGAAAINSTTFRPGENLIQPNTPSKIGHTFAGWYTNITLTTPFTFGSMPDQNLNLYAKWTVNSYTISFEMNGGNLINDLTFAYDQTITITSEITKIGHTFIGWYTDASLTSLFTLTKMPAQNFTLYAKWEISSYTISFETSGGSAISSITQVYDTVLNAPEDPIREGHTFAGWYSDAELNTLFTFSTVPAADTVLYAKWTVNTYTLSYVTNTDSSLGTQVISYGVVIPIEHNLTKDGYAFAGWYTDQAFEIPLSFDMMPAFDLTLYAKWSRSITFMSNGGSDVESMILDPGVDITLPDDPIRIGYTFAGWYIDEALMNPFVISVMPDDNLMLYAKWNINQYTISFNSNGGSVVSSITQDFESIVTAPNQPEKEGYSFIGWTSDQEGTIDYIFDIMPASDLTLYAQWKINSYMITFDTGEGTAVDSITQDYQTELTEPADPTRLFYTFDGWYEDQEYLTLYTFNLMEARNLTLYAKWLPDQFIISLELNGGTGDTALTERYTLPIEAPLPKKEGYTFDGWFTDSALTNPYVFSTMPPQNFTLYAKWNINAYTITFETYGGTTYNPIIKIYNTSTPVMEDPIKEGYTFTGWFLDESFEEVYVYSNMPAKDITLYARWHNSIIFNSNGGSVLETITLPAGNIVVKPSNPVKLGHTFVDWYEDKELTIPYVFSTMPEPNITIYAKWDVNQYIIGFEPNGGDYVETIMQDFGTELDLPTPVRTGYSFIGWYKDAELTQTLDFTLVQASNIVLYAKWEINQYTITFETNGGDIVESITQDYDTEFELPTTTKEGYTFVGWYIDGPLSQAIDFSKIPANDSLLYAKWEINQYQMAFNTDGGTLINPIIQDYNSEITEPQDPTKEGHTFIGWYADQSLTEEYTFSLMPSYDVAIYAKWIVNSYTISFNTNGGTEVSPIVQDFGTYINYPAIPQKADKVFIGWFEDVDLINEFYIQIMPSENITLYAKWGNYSPLYNVYSDHSEVIGFDIAEGYVETIDLIIPSTYNGVPITVIAANSFANQTQLSSITIPNSVTTIQNGSFSGISNITSLSIPFIGTNRTVTSANFYELFGSSVSSIPSSLTLVKITDQENLPNYAFKSIYTITHYELPSNLKKIGTQAFAQRLYNTNPARYFMLPDSLEYIGESAFTGSNFAEPLVFSESMSYVAMNAFWSANNVQIYAPSPSLYIGIWAFKEASNVKLYVSVSNDSGWPRQWDEYTYSIVVTWNHIFNN